MRDAKRREEMYKEMREAQKKKKQSSHLKYRPKLVKIMGRPKGVKNSKPSTRTKNEFLAKINFIINQTKDKKISNKQKLQMLKDLFKKEN